MKKAFIGVYNLANCVTYLGIAAAVVGICFADKPKIAMLTPFVGPGTVLNAGCAFAHSILTPTLEQDC